MYCEFFPQYEWNEEHFGDLNAELSEEEKSKRENHRYEIPPTYAIWICDFPVGKQEDYYGTWAVRNEKGLTFNDKMMYILYDLTKFTKTIDEVKTAGSICSSTQEPPKAFPTSMMTLSQKRLTGCL